VQDCLVQLLSACALSAQTTCHEAGVFLLRPFHPLRCGPLSTVGTSHASGCSTSAGNAAALLLFKYVFDSNASHL
jgi:hypothetical protein